MFLEVARKHPDAILPEKGSTCAAGFDLFSVQDYSISPGQRVLVDTGLVIGIPKEYEGQVRPRSGMALKHGITVLNSPGTIDSDYRNPDNLVGVILVNHSDTKYEVKKGDRIAQLIISQVAPMQIKEVQSPSPIESNRYGGFGSSGQ